jgi:hypothetical protein
MTPRNLSLALLSLAPLACDAGGTGTVQVFVEAEDTIPEGLQPGDGAEDVVDGWTVKYDKFIVTVGDFRASRSEGDGDTLSAPTIYVVDLLNVPAGGVVLAEFEDVAAERWDQVGYSMPNATDEAVAAEGTAKADRDMMVAGGLSLYVAGEITKPDGESCGFDDPVVCTPAPSVRFAWGLQAGTSFSDCAPPTGALGFAVPSGGTAQVKPTIHGDHWFFTNLTQGSEVTERRAQWIADADLDLDGETTLEELGDLSATLLFTAERGYNLSGSIIKIVTAYDYLEAQARTLGDFQGEGECPTRKIL